MAESYRGIQICPSPSLLVPTEFIPTPNRPCDGSSPSLPILLKVSPHPYPFARRMIPIPTRRCKKFFPSLLVQISVHV